jgi:hypothetical protein
MINIEEYEDFVNVGLGLLKRRETLSLKFLSCPWLE